MQTKETVLRISNLTISYTKKCVVDGFNLNMKNESLVLFGPSGCGKTTILKSILNIHENGKKVVGNIDFVNNDIDFKQGDVGMTFQGPIIPGWLKLRDLCMLGRKIQALDILAREQAVQDMLQNFGIEHLIEKYPSEMSGGEKQRIALAITLLNKPKLLLLDEPTTFIDGATRLQIWKYIENYIVPMNIPTIIVSHDPIEAIMLADRVLILDNQAKVKKELEIPFIHPRDEKIYKMDEFWKLKDGISISNSSS